MVRKTLLICGVLSPLLYAVADVVAGKQWEGYSFRDQTISELGAIGAPSRPLFAALLLVVYALMVAFGVGIWKSAGGIRRLRVVGGLLVGLGVMALTIGQLAAIHMRGTEQRALTLHLVEGMAAMLMIFTAMGIAGTIFGTRFRLYTIATIILVLGFGAWAVSEVSRAEQGLATPWVGVKERIFWYGYQTWFIVLALTLLRKPLAVRVEDGTKEGMSSRKKFALTIAAVMLFGATIIVVAYESEIRPIRTKVLSGGSIVETDLGKIEYAAVGAGTPLLSIHGAGGGYDQGLLIGTALVGNGFRVIAPSRFGYLRTPVPSDASPAAQADAHAALLDVLGIDRAIVVGTSAGAPSATQLALRHPDKVAALILLAPQGYAPGHTVQVDPTPGNRIVLKVVQAGSDIAYWSMLHGTPSVVIRFMGVPPEVLKKADLGDRQWATRVLTSVHPLSMRVAGIANDSSIRLDAWPLERIGAPTLIFTSSDDLFHTQPAAEYAAANIPNAKLVVYPTGGHLFIGHTADLRSAVAVFLEQSLPNNFMTDEPAANVSSSAQK